MNFNLVELAVTDMVKKKQLIASLQKDVYQLQKFSKTSINEAPQTGLGPIEQAFPEHTFPTGAVHEFLSYSQENAAATNGFISGIMASLMQQKGACLWISARGTIYPPALKSFGINPERVIFIDLARPKEALWAIEEALKCEALSAVIGELKELSFTESRRLQLAVEQSRVTGFIHRYNPRNENIVACVTRWKVRPIMSATEDGMPGVGFPRWRVQLVKVRNGKPGAWDMEWYAGRFRYIPAETFSIQKIRTRQTG